MALKRELPSWADVLAAPNAVVEDCIRCGGLAEIKTARIKKILRTIVDETGDAVPSLEYLRDKDTEEVKRILTAFPGVGPKTISCVIMFCLERPEFPVDTHVWRIAKMLKWVPPTATRETTYAHLNHMIPDVCKYDLHVLLVEHGKRCHRCAKNGRPRKESVGECPLQRTDWEKMKGKALLHYGCTTQA